MDLIHGEMKLIDWQDDKKWSDRFIPFIKPILGLYLIGEATQEDDKNKNTDLIVFKMDAVRIACRIRRYSYYKKYNDEFTIRNTRPSNNKSELAKIIGDGVIIYSMVLVIRKKTSY